MREIKFRAWLNPPFGENEGNYEMVYDIAFEDYAPLNDHPKGVKTLMQYTGLRDKNDAEIYEGDILKSDAKDAKGLTWIGVVEANEYGGLSLKYFEYSNAYKKGQWLAKLAGSIHDPQTASWVAANCTIIGDIYANPEFLLGVL